MNSRNLSFGKRFLLMIICIALNFGGKFLAESLMLPLWLDTIGTFTAAYFFGIGGAVIAGVCNNLIFGMVQIEALLYILSSSAIGIFLAACMKKQNFENFTKAMLVGFWTGVMSIVVTVPVNMIFFEGKSSNKWGDIFFSMLEWHGMPRVICSIGDALIVDIIDKMVTAAIAYVVIKITIKIIDGKKMRASKVSALVLALVIAGGTLFMCPMTVSAENNSDKSISTIYMSDDEVAVLQESNCPEEEVHAWESSWYKTYFILAIAWLCSAIVWVIVKTGMMIKRKKEMANLKEQAKNEFLANMSHEFRTCLNTILGMNEMILQNNPGDRITECSENIRIAGNSLLTLINDILDISAIESGKLELVSERYDLDRLLKEEIAVLKYAAGQKGIETFFVVDDNLPAQLEGDPHRIKQIMDNLISNAVKFTDNGQITFFVGGLMDSKSDFSLIITLSDTGSGISEEDKKKLFDGFDRRRHKNNRTIGGTGLGLSITKALVEMMNGTIMVQSVVGSGSVFTVKVPQKISGDSTIESFRCDSCNKHNTAERCFTIPDARILAVDDKICEDEPVPDDPVNEEPDWNEVASKEHDSYIDRRIGMKYCDNDEELYDELVESYCEVGRKYRRQLKEYFDKADWKNYAIIAHALKSTSLNIGARELSELAKIHEFAAKAEDADTVAESFDRFTDLLETVLDAAEKMIHCKESSVLEERGLFP